MKINEEMQIKAQEQLYERERRLCMILFWNNKKEGECAFGLSQAVQTLLGAKKTFSRCREAARRLVGSERSGDSELGEASKRMK